MPASLAANNLNAAIWKDRAPTVAMLVAAPTGRSLIAHLILRNGERVDAEAFEERSGARVGAGGSLEFGIRLDRTKSGGEPGGVHIDRAVTRS